MADNKMASKEAGKALAEALKANLTLKELDVSGNTWEDEIGKPKGDGPGFAQELAFGVATSRAMTKLTISGDDDDDDESKPVTIETTMTKADFSGKNLHAAGAIMLAAFLPKCR